MQVRLYTANGRQTALYMNSPSKYTNKNNVETIFRGNLWGKLTLQTCKYREAFQVKC